MPYIIKIIAKTERKWLFVKRWETGKTDKIAHSDLYETMKASLDDT